LTGSSTPGVDAAALIPVHVLTGFLGSGKTTLLNRALSAGFGPETGVVVNEFGEAGLDSLFVQSRSTETIVLASGCVCCTLRGDLPQALLELLAASTVPLKRIVIETSGVSEPMPILQTLRVERTLSSRFSAGSVVCTVPASEGAAVVARPESLAQLTAADGLVMTKRDLAGVADEDALRAAVSEVNPLAEWIEHDGAALVDRLGFEDTGRRAFERRPWSRLAAWPPTRRSTHRLSSLVVRAPPPASWARFAVWLTRLIHLHGDRILRMKGVLHDSQRGVWVGIHGVKRFLHPPVHLALKEPPADGTTLVFITEGLDAVRIERSYFEEVVPDPLRSDPDGR
jgi:G3E family GTPase